jgi:hypothetical protein
MWLRLAASLRPVALLHRPVSSRGMTAWVPRPRAAPRVVALASLAQLENAQLTAWTPTVVDAHIVRAQELRHGTATTTTDVKSPFVLECEHTFLAMQRDGAPLSLQDRYFNMWCQHGKPALRHYAALIRTHARSGAAHNLPRILDLYRDCATKHRALFDQLGIVPAAVTPPHSSFTVISTAPAVVVASSFVVQGALVVPATTLVGVANLFEALTFAFCAAAHPDRALPFLRALTVIVTEHSQVTVLRSAPRQNASLARKLGSAATSFLRAIAHFPTQAASGLPAPPTNLVRDV